MKFQILLISFCLFVFLSKNTSAQYWQQEADYIINVDIDVKKHQMEVDQEILYTNHSPDTLDQVFFHLFFNAFQPNSMMDVRSRTIADPDKRVSDRISLLDPNEIGFHEIKSMSIDGKECSVEVQNTIAEVQLPNAILPGQTVSFKLTYLSQIPVQIRRSGRDNKEGISYSMTQWYVKLCEYDHMGWHANPYVGREFHGIWGDYEVNINIDSDFIVGAGGTLTNPKKLRQKIKGNKVKYNPRGKKATWSYEAKNVIDFAWAADPEYVHLKETAYDGTIVNYIYQPSEKTDENWKALHPYMDASLKFMNERYGKYQYPSYTFIQGGDGGMEYPLITLITGERTLESLIGVSIHEWMHSWYQMMLATNESLYSWMDEGFTSFGSSEVLNHLRSIDLMEGDVQDNPIFNSMVRYGSFAMSGMEESLNTHSDHYSSNAAYGVGSYVKGAVYLKQLEYIIGQESFGKGLKRYFNEWKFKHPSPNDFIRVMEKTSKMELDWYNQYFVNSTKFIDLAIDSVYGDQNSTTIEIGKYGEMPIPVDLFIETNTQGTIVYHIPITLTRAIKEEKLFEASYIVGNDWPWTHPTYLATIDLPIDEIKSIVIDPTGRMADVSLENNVYPPIEIEEEIIEKEK